MIELIPQPTDHVTSIVGRILRVSLTLTPPLHSSFFFPLLHVDSSPALDSETSTRNQPPAFIICLHHLVELGDDPRSSFHPLKSATPLIAGIARSEPDRYCLLEVGDHLIASASVFIHQTWSSSSPNVTIMVTSPPTRLTSRRSSSAVTHLDPPTTFFLHLTHTRTRN
jgi:hypothetical protein